MPVYPGALVTPLLPLVDLFPSFSDCARRVFMSATIPDDSEIVRSFEVDPKAATSPHVSKSLAGVSERMIIAPELMGLKPKDTVSTLKAVASKAAEKAKFGTVILVPSGPAANKWKDVAEYGDTPQVVQDYVTQLLQGRSFGPFVFANRYDGIDLPDAACRILILDGLPRGTGEYETYRANAFAGATLLNRAIAQKIEQGMGRAARGPGDFCVVLVSGRDLVAWLGKTTNLKFLTTSTAAQLDMGVEISKNITDTKDFVGTINRCLTREKDWVKYHAETLAELTFETNTDIESVSAAAVERDALRLWRDGYHERAIGKLVKRCESKTTEEVEIGWLLQYAARIAYDWGRKELATELQQRAFAANRNVMRPSVGKVKVEALLPGPQAQAIVKRIGPFRFRSGYVADFDQNASFLTPDSSSDQFESALAELGNILGFVGTRPEKTYGEGPDVLWVISPRTGWVIEAKSRKNEKNALTKEQHGQLLVSENWFKREYKGLSGVRVSVHPNVTATKRSVPNQTKALTITKLNELIAETRQLIVALCESGYPTAELAPVCEKLLRASKLTPGRLTDYYLIDFEVKELG